MKAEEAPRRGRPPRTNVIAETHPGLPIEDPLQSLPPSARWVLQCARRILVEKGFPALTLENIALESQESKASIQRYFGSKSGRSKCSSTRSSMTHTRLSSVRRRAFHRVKTASTRTSAACTRSSVTSRRRGVLRDRPSRAPRRRAARAVRATVRVAPRAHCTDLRPRQRPAQPREAGRAGGDDPRDARRARLSGRPRSRGSRRQRGVRALFGFIQDSLRPGA